MKPGRRGSQLSQAFPAGPQGTRAQRHTAAYPAATLVTLSRAVVWNIINLRGKKFTRFQMLFATSFSMHKGHTDSIGQMPQAELLTFQELAIPS